MIFWCWLSTNAAAVQAIGSLLSFVVAAITIPVLIRTMKVARQAAEAAKEQALAAAAQVRAAEQSSKFSELQVLAAQEAAAAEREHSSLIRQQTQASLRPVLVFVKRLTMSRMEIIIENQTEAIALGIEGWNGTPEKRGKPLNLGQGILGGRSETYAEGLDWGRSQRDSFGQVTYPDPAPAFLLYESQDGRKFITLLESINTRPLVQTVREK